MTVVADTGAVMALIDGDDRHHQVLREAFEKDPQSWVLPWAVLPEVDHLVATRLGPAVAGAFRSDLAGGLFSVEWGEPGDLVRAAELDRLHADLGLGLVDGVVMAVAERLRADAIATLDLRIFAAVELEGSPRLLPRDL
jgi:predicted nucleic acid-binding protein